MKPIVLILSLIIFVACKSDDNANNDSNSFANIVNILPQGTWKISYFYEDNSDETSTYSSFVFSFRNDGSLTAANDILSDIGTWQYEDSTNDSSDDDGIAGDEELLITFPSRSFFEDLTDNWHITSVSSTEIVLYDVSGGNGTTDYLTFTKQ